MKNIIWLSVFALFFGACERNIIKKDTNNDTSNVITVDTIQNDTTPITNYQELTVFFINDQHGQIENFSKIKHIIDIERQKTNVITTCSGDMFSGNPTVDNYPQPGYPMIDLMNRVGFDVVTLGNHEFDYGEENLKNCIEQSNFAWVSANINTQNTNISSITDFVSIEIDSLRVTFIGLVETGGKPNDTIPLTHPLKVENFKFEKYYDIVGNYSELKNQENADLLIALTHLGKNTDERLAEQFPIFDLIIGGHSHSKLYTTVNGIPIMQAGAKLKYLGKAELKIRNKQIIDITYNLIDLSTYVNYDSDLMSVIENYNNEVSSIIDVNIGFAEADHSKSNVGCFYTDALRQEFNVDACFQNSGGIRSDLDYGDISIREIYEIDPFNNGVITLTMTVLDIKNMIKTIGGLYYSGIIVEISGNEITIKDSSNNILDDSATLTIVINDYIPAVYDTIFPVNYETHPITTAEAIISFLKASENNVNYTNCNNYIDY